ncbi:MAG: hypothetical protein CVV44_13145 [Spirochaetae bacterium HGW-Spirochaetae-1]|jgi:hypothetical protein|nr:MAG: hypothetical protein CVV44_13145 [Spirochaetae bacterium HGW-Spirochaetae-1]
MADNLKSAADSLVEQTRRFDIATYYCNGDTEKAKQMVAGALKDQYVIKARFSSSSQYGAFIIFYNSVYSYVSNITVLVSPSFALEDIKTSLDWRHFEEELKKLLDKGEHDAVMCNHAREEINGSMNMEFNKELNRLLEINDAITINHRFKKMVQDRLGFQQIKIIVDHEPSSSLDMELSSVTGRKLDPEEIKKQLKQQGDEKLEEEQRLNKEVIIEKVDDPLSGKEVRLILQGSLILSPIKGKDVGEVVAGDRIKIKIIDSNPKAIQVARAFKAYDEETGNIAPIIGRVVSAKYTSREGYKFFAIIAKGIYVHIDEEEENIKVAVEDPAATGQKDSAEAPSKISMPVILVLIVVFICLVGGILIFLL